MTKLSAIVCTVHLRHRSKQKHTEAQQCIIPPGFSLILVKTLVAVLTLVFCMKVRDSTSLKILLSLFVNSEYNIDGLRSPCYKETG